MAGGPKLTGRAERAIAALLTAATLGEAAQQAGISVRTLRYWLQKPDFQRAYREARQQVLDRTVCRLLAACLKAVATLEANLDCDSPAGRNRAALGILEHAIKAGELRDLAAEVAELRQRFGEGKA